MLKRFRRFAMVLAAALMAASCAQTDAGITASVKTKLAADETVKAHQINVTTNAKVVTLSGTVDTKAAKDQAIALARGTQGVADVVDQIAVLGEARPTTGQAGEMPSDPERRRTAEELAEDATITTVVKGKLIADSIVSGLKIDVDTNRGVVTLNGNVDSEAQRAQALKLARETADVKDVIDRLVVRK